MKKSCLLISLIFLFIFLSFNFVNGAEYYRFECGDGTCNEIESCFSCPQDCGCKEDEICVETSLENKPLYYCKQFIDLNGLKKSREITLSFKPFKSHLSIRNNGKDYSWVFNSFWQNGTKVYHNGKSFELYEGESITLGLDSFSKEGNDLSVKLLDRQGDTIKLLFSKPSKFNFNFYSFFYWVNGLLVVLILIFGGFYILNKNKQKDKKRIVEEDVEESSDEIEKTKKSEIPKSITSAIEVNNFKVKHGSKTILEDVDFKINRGDFITLLGTSGTGKSTIIEALVNRKKPTKGSVKIFNKDVGSDNSIFEHVGFVPQNPELYLNQTVEQNLKNSAIKWGIKNPDKKIEQMLEKLNLSHRKNLKAGKLSGGQSKLLSLGMELIRDPELIILDEPTTGLDPNTRNNIITILSNLSRYNHNTILITTHFMDDAEESDEIILIGNKKILVQGTPEKLKRRLPGGGKVISIILDNVTEDLMKKIDKIKGVEKVIREGRSLNILTNNPDPIEMANKLKEVGGSILESKIVKASMKEVFVYYTGEDLPEK